MLLHELADEFALTTAAAADLCTRLGIPARSEGDEVSDADVERFRQAARADLALGGPETSAPFAAPAPGSAGPDDVTAGWAAPDPAGAWAPGSNGHGLEPEAPGMVGGDQPSWARSADLARLDAARARATSYINSGYALLALGLVITVATMALAPGGFFIVSFGTVFVGFRRLRVGRTIRAQVHQAEQEMGRG